MKNKIEKRAFTYKDLGLDSIETIRPINKTGQFKKI